MSRLRRPGATPFVAVIVAALVGAGIGVAVTASMDRGGGGGSAAPTLPASPAVSTAEGALSVNQIYRLASPGVVEITVTSGGADTSPFPYGGGAQQAQGSGFVYDANGHVVTNEHVVSGGGSITVRFSDGSTSKATLVGSDASTDIAVLKVDAPSSKLHPLALADSGSVQVGDGVVAIGSPFGLENSVTSGIVSALHRDITAPNDFTIDDAIQTDAAINHGNSGGPLLDLHGHVIGVTAQIKSDSGGNEGVGFAIPSGTVRSVASRLISSGKVEHAYLGVAIESIPSDAAKTLGVPQGAEVTTVRAGTPAAKAGLVPATGQRIVGGQVYPTGGDVIVALDGKTVGSADELRALVDARAPRDTVTLTVVRSGKQRTVHVTLAQRPS